MMIVGLWLDTMLVSVFMVGRLAMGRIDEC